MRDASQLLSQRPHSAFRKLDMTSSVSPIVHTRFDRCCIDCNFRSCYCTLRSGHSLGCNRSIDCIPWFACCHNCSTRRRGSNLYSIACKFVGQSFDCNRYCTNHWVRIPKIVPSWMMNCCSRSTIGRRPQRWKLVKRARRRERKVWQESS